MFPVIVHKLCIPVIEHKLPVAMDLRMQPTNDHDQAVNPICETGYISQSVNEETERTSLTGPVTEHNNIQV